MRVGDARDGGDAPLQLLGHPQVGHPIVADGAHVDLGWQSEVQDLGDDVGGLKIEGDFREAGRQRLAQLSDIVRGRRVAFFERTPG